MKRYLPARIVLFPGLGADARMFDRLRRRLGSDLECPAWLEPKPDESFDAYAARWTQLLRPEPGDDRALFLGGVSFGGMVALRMAVHLKPRAVILLGSCRSGAARPARWQPAWRIGSAIPHAWLGRRVLALGGLYVSLLDRLDEPHRRLMLKMAADTSPRRARWCGRMCAEWDFDPSAVAEYPPIHQLHGRHDAIIPLHPGDPDTVIEDGRHILVFSHEQTVCRYIMDVVRGCLKAGN